MLIDLIGFVKSLIVQSVRVEMSRLSDGVTSLKKVHSYLKISHWVNLQCLSPIYSSTIIGQLGLPWIHTGRLAELIARTDICCRDNKLTSYPEKTRDYYSADE